MSLLDQELPCAGIEANDLEALNRRYEYYDPVYTLPASGQEWWRHQAPAFAQR